jgi:hypothetical protein
MMLSLLLLLAMGSYCQEIPKYKKDKFGISLGYKYSALQTTYSENFSNQIDALTIENSPGFSMGILYQRNITDALGLRFQPLLMFEGGRLNYDMTNQSDIQESIRPMSLSFPVHVLFTKAKENPMKGVSPSVLIGGQFIYDVYDEENSVLELNKTSFGLDVGGGLYRKFEYFDARLELIYTFGINNLLQESNSIYHQAIESIQKDMIAIRMIFFG